ncbi:MAG: VWA domain-containing protein [Acidimicrobiia bacterium]|nr:VWA domain-containing protein [Acidimicrobiia bacterium]
MIDQARRTVSRRDLDRNERFADVSPEVGSVDIVAFDELMEEDPDEGLTLLAAMAQATDRDLAQFARQLASRLALDVARTGPARSRGTGKLVRMPASADRTDLDIDASMDAIVAARADRRPVDLDDLTASGWRRPSTALCLLIDRSGSMNGERLAAAALAAAACSYRAPHELAILTFSDRVIEIKALSERRPIEHVVGDVLSLRGHGTTDVALALKAAGRQLARSTAQRNVTVLLSDAEVTAGRDPTAPARALDELIILAPSDDARHAEALVKSTGARLGLIDGPSSLVETLRSVLA